MPASFDVTMCQNQTVRFFGTSPKSHSVIRTGSYRKPDSSRTACKVSLSLNSRLYRAALEQMATQCLQSQRELEPKRVMDKGVGDEWACHN
jgi:hypothetical protein